MSLNGFKLTAGWGAGGETVPEGVDEAAHLGQPRAQDRILLRCREGIPGDGSRDLTCIDGGGGRGCSR